MSQKDTYDNACSVLAGRKAEVTDEQAEDAVSAVMYRVDMGWLDLPDARQVLDMLGLIEQEKT